MSRLRWNSISANLGAGNSAMGNALQATRGATSSFSNAYNILNKERQYQDDVKQNELNNKLLAESREFEKKKYQDLLKQQELNNSLKVFDAETKGYNQGDKVKDALSNITLNTDKLDNKPRIDLVNSFYDKAASNDKLSSYISKLDEAGVSTKDAGKVLTGEDLTNFLKLKSDADSKISNYNKGLLSNVDKLYKTDANTAVSALESALLDKGVNPEYAKKIAAEKSLQFTKASPSKMSEKDKELVDFLNKSINNIYDNYSIKNKTSKTSGSGKSGNGKGDYVPSKLSSKTPADIIDTTKYTKDVLKLLGVDNSYLNASGELKDVSRDVSYLARTPYKIINPKTGRPELRYLSKKGIAEVLSNDITENLVRGNQYNFDKDSVESRNVIKSILLKDMMNSSASTKTQGNGYGSKTVSTETKTLPKQQQLQVNKLQNMLSQVLTKRNTPTDNELVKNILGIR